MTSGQWIYSKFWWMVEKTNNIHEAWTTYMKYSEYHSSTWACTVQLLAVMTWKRTTQGNLCAQRQQKGNTELEGQCPTSNRYWTVKMAALFGKDLAGPGRNLDINPKIYKEEYYLHWVTTLYITCICGGKSMIVLAGAISILCPATMHWNVGFNCIVCMPQN